MKLEQIGVVYALHAFHTHFYLLYNLAILPLSCSFVWKDCCMYVASPLSLVCKMLCVFICMQLPPTPMTACAASYSEMHVTFSADTLWIWWALYICIEIVFEEAAEETLTSQRLALFCIIMHMQHSLLLDLPCFSRFNFSGSRLSCFIRTMMLRLDKLT